MAVNNNQGMSKQTYGTAIRQAFSDDTQSISVNTDVKRIKFGKKFTTLTTDYDLLQDTDIKAILLNYYTSDEILAGIDITASIFVDSASSIKINNQPFYNDFLSDAVFDTTQIINSIIIKDAGITGYLEVVFNG